MDCSLPFPCSKMHLYLIMLMISYINSYACIKYWPSNKTKMKMCLAWEDLKINDIVSAYLETNISEGP